MSVNTPSLTLSDYLEKQPGTSFRRLYQQPSTTLAIFRRMLPSLAKVLVIRLLYFVGPMKLETWDAMVKPEAKRQKDQALTVLRSLHIIQITGANREVPQEMVLTTNFKKSLRLALEGGGDHNSFGVPSEIPVSQEIDVAFLDRYARRKWEDILHYVVNSVGMAGSHDSSGPKNSVKELLVAGRLVERRGGGHGGVGITQMGFTFLLQAANAQVWTLLLLWLEAVDHSRNANSEMDSVDMLSFLFMLSTLELGRAYDTTALTEQRRNMLPSLVDFGLIYIPPHDRSSQYFPTRLATTLTSSAAALRSVSAGFSAASTDAAAASGLPGSNSAPETKGSIILETNYRLYAYTTSPLQIAVLALFTKLSARFPGMVTGKLSRDSIRQAISYGITSDQIISYLATHAHEQMHRHAANASRPVLPPTVVDQIRLWQLENERMKATSGFLFKEFDSTKEYEVCAQFADEIGVLLWRNDRRQMFFAAKHEQLGAYLKSWKKANEKAKQG